MEKIIQWKTNLEKQRMLKFKMDVVADKGLVHHLFTEYMSFILLINDMYSRFNFFNKGGDLLSQLIHTRNHTYRLVKRLHLMIIINWPDQIKCGLSCSTHDLSVIITAESLSQFSHFKKDRNWEYFDEAFKVWTKTDTLVNFLMFLFDM